MTQTIGAARDELTPDEIAALKRMAELLPEVEEAIARLTKIAQGCPAARHVLTR
jgi:hypothetical protein